MCKFCLEHGEGKKWYLQVKNYADELLTEERKELMKNLLINYEASLANLVLPLGEGLAKNPAQTRAELIPSLEQQLETLHHGQVILLEEAQQIMDLAPNIVRFFCACRSSLQGKYYRYCYGFSAFKSDFLPFGFLEPYPDYSQNFETLTPEEAKKELEKYERQGMVHTVWTMLTPFIIHICNCTARDCLALKGRLQTGTRTLYKGEHIARYDMDLCDGCQDCMKVCNFGAITYSLSLKKCFVNSFLCYGCGLCRWICRRDAITMVDRNTIPALVNEW